MGGKGQLLMWNLGKPSRTRHGRQTKLKQASPGSIALACGPAPKYLSSMCVGRWTKALEQNHQAWTGRNSWGCKLGGVTSRAVGRAERWDNKQGWRNGRQPDV